MLKNKPLLTAGLLVPVILFALFFAFSRVPAVKAAPPRQVPIYTPTPGPDGRIIYIVKANDTLLSISLLTGVSVDELRAINNLKSDIIIEGQPLLLGMAGPLEVTPTPGPSPTPTPLLPTPTVKPGLGKLCILLYNDLNGDSIRQESEPSIPDGAININNRTGSVSKTEPTTAGDLPYCLADIPEGAYNISVAVPAGYNPTTETTFVLTLKAGDETYLNFGAEANSVTVAEAPLPTGESRSPVLGIVGGVLVIAGIGLALFAGRILKSK